MVTRVYLCVLPPNSEHAHTLLFFNGHPILRPWPRYGYLENCEEGTGQTD